MSKQPNEQRDTVGGRGHFLDGKTSGVLEREEMVAHGLAYALCGHLRAMAAGCGETETARRDRLLAAAIGVAGAVRRI